MLYFLSRIGRKSFEHDDTYTVTYIHIVLVCVYVLSSSSFTLYFSMATISSCHRSMDPHCSLVAIPLVNMDP
jgi:hypothetical protein